MFHKALLRVSRVAFALVVLAGCSAKHAAVEGDDETAQLAQDGSDSSSAESDTETLVTSLMSGSGSGVALASSGGLSGGGLHLDNIGDGAKAYYLPAGCLKVTDNPPTKSVTYQFDRCTGPLGLAHVTGTVVVSYAVVAVNKLVLDFVGTQLSVNRATVDWSAHAEITAALLGKRSMVWKGQFSGTTARGRSLSRSNDKVVEWTVGQTCVRVNGTSDGDVVGRSLHTDIIGYERCKGECPGAGSEIKITDTKSKRSIDIKYDGTRIATFTGLTGTATQITLACGL